MKLKTYDDETSVVDARRTALFEEMARQTDALCEPTVWRFPPSVAGGVNRVIYWHFEVPGEAMSSIFDKLLMEFQCLMACILSRAARTPTPASVGSVPSLGVAMRELFRWMVHHGIQSFSGLTPAVRQRYLEDLPQLILSGEDFYNGVAPVDSKKSGKKRTSWKAQPVDFAEAEYFQEGEEYENQDDEQQDDDELSYRQVASRVVLLYHIAAHRGALADCGIKTFEGQAFGDKSLKSVVNPVAALVVHSTPPLPDEVAAPLLAEALSFIEVKYRDIVKLRDLYMTHRAIRIGPAEYYGAKSENASPFESFVFSELTAGAGPWRGELIEGVVNHPRFGDRLLHRPQLLRGLLLRCRDAAFVILSFLVGMRPSEICSIQVDKKSDLLHGCIERRLSRSGLLEMFFVKAWVKKGREAPELEEWLIGSRPFNAKWEPPALTAIRVVMEIFSPWTSTREKFPLFQSFVHGKSIPIEDSFCVPATGPVLSSGLQELAYYEIDWDQVPAVSSRGENLARFKSSRGFAIRSLHGRKTFAAYVLESRSSLLGAVSRHFKHRDTAVTEMSYYGKEHRMKYDADSERRSATIARMEELLTGRVNIVGRMAPVIAEFFKSRGWEKYRDRGALHRAIILFVDETELRIFFGRHSDCYISANPLESECRKAAQSQGWSELRPDFTHRAPSTCAGCGCGAIDASHLPFWEARSATPDRDPVEFRVEMARKAQALKIVKRIRAMNKAVSQSNDC